VRKNVILFDIDGTLLSIEKIDQDETQRYVHAIRDVTGKEVNVNVKPTRFAGMIDPQICNILLSELGLDEKARKDVLPNVLVRMGEVYQKKRKRSPILNDGVLELLHALSQSTNHVLGVLTGNISAVGEEKLAITQTHSYFTERFYADEYQDRLSLVEDAVELCVAKHQLPKSESVIIVGDTPLDIAAANAANATSIGIASGVYSKIQPWRARATSVFQDLKPSSKLLTTLGFETKNS
jgi:phosphoglycolate phosphatase-like HAD superfamily hydrolase